MLTAVKGKDRSIKEVIRKDDRLYLYSEAGNYRLEMRTPGCVRVTYTCRDTFSNTIKPGVLSGAVSDCWEYSEENGCVFFWTGELKICIDCRTAVFRYMDNQGNLLLQEHAKCGKELEEFTVYEPVGETIKVEQVTTADGVKNVVREADRVANGTLYHTRLNLEWQEQEALYGLGQHEEGVLNLRGKTVYLHQANRKIAIPMLVSSLGYGLLMDTYSPMIFNDTEYGSYLYTEADEEMDFYFIYGGNMDGVIREYRLLTGKATMLPKWAFGYIQSQERYETEQEILEVTEGYRKREIGLDGVVLDWCSWEGSQWGQKTLDKQRFPHPEEMIRKLHRMHTHFMISIWPNMDEQTKDYQEFANHGWLLPGTNVYNALEQGAGELYWNQVQKGLFCHGVDAWWCDNSEPFTPEWNHMERMEPSKLYEVYCRSVSNHMPLSMGNAYGLYHAKNLYEGQRGAECDKTKRVVNLTRSGYTGQQRYGTILWSGDIAANWETLEKQIAAGLSFCASGLPYWTVDIGAFFVKDGAPWYWKGDYDKTTADKRYQELFVRWYQWAGFLPVFRGHGTDCRRELWKVCDEGSVFYEALLEANRLRYRLLPYIYSMAGKVWLEDASMIKPLAFAFPKDAIARNLKDQYLFGDSMLVCPIIHSMYEYSDVGEPEQKQLLRKVYLPDGTGWYNYWTNTYYKGGQWVEAEVAIEHIPVFVREGAIIPHTQPASSTEELSDELEIRVYAGRDGRYVLYSDAGDGYEYEKGDYLTCEFRWNEMNHQLTVEDTINRMGKVISVKVTEQDGSYVD